MSFKKIWMFTILSLVATSFIATHGALAADKTPKLRMGLGGAASSRLYKDLEDDKRYLPMPLLFGDYGPVFIEGISAGIRAINTDRLKMEFMVSRGVNGYKPSDSPVLEGMEERKEGIDGGARITYWSDYGGIMIRGLADIGHTHDGEEATLKYMVPIKTQWLTLVPAIGGTWRSADKVNYYFGVRENESREGRPAYKASSDISGFIALEMTLPITQSISMVGGGKAEYLGDQVHNSPIVNEDFLVSTYLGVVLTIM